MGDETTIKDVAKLQAQMESVREDIHDIKQSVGSLLEFTQQARGSWRTLMAVAGVSAGIGGLVGKLMPYIPFR